MYVIFILYIYVILYVCNIFKYFIYECSMYSMYVCMYEYMQDFLI